MPRRLCQIHSRQKAASGGGDTVEEAVELVNAKAAKSGKAPAKKAAAKKPAAKKAAAKKPAAKKAGATKTASKKTAATTDGGS